jgi:hypothetical protein
VKPVLDIQGTNTVEPGVYFYLEWQTLSFGDIANIHCHIRTSIRFYENQKFSWSWKQERKTIDNILDRLTNNINIVNILSRAIAFLCLYAPRSCMNTWIYLGMMFIICSSIRMCKLKYIWGFIQQSSLMFTIQDYNYLYYFRCFR